jgi:N-acetylated-alpha-linked acidic dipeptidase
LIYYYLLVICSVFHGCYEENSLSLLCFLYLSVAGIWGLLGILLADEPLIPFDYISYADQLQAHRDKLSKLLEGKVSVNPLSMAIQEFSLVAKEAADEAKVSNGFAN